MSEMFPRTPRMAIDDDFRKQDKKKSPKEDTEEEVSEDEKEGEHSSEEKATSAEEISPESDAAYMTDGDDFRVKEE